MPYLHVRMRIRPPCVDAQCQCQRKPLADRCAGHDERWGGVEERRLPGRR